MHLYLSDHEYHICLNLSYHVPKHLDFFLYVFVKCALKLFHVVFPIYTRTEKPAIIMAKIELFKGELRGQARV